MARITAIGEWPALPTTLVVQEAHRRRAVYDPWGLELAGIGYLADPAKESKFTYNGKEKQDQFGLGWLDCASADYHARQVDPALGRMWAVDPLAGKFAPLSPYVYVANNPLLFVDPDGMEAKPPTDIYPGSAGPAEKPREELDLMGGGEPFFRRNPGIDRLLEQQVVNAQPSSSNQEQPPAAEAGSKEEVERSELAPGGGPPQIPFGQWVKPSSLKVKNIARAWYGSAHIEETIVAFRFPYIRRAKLNVTVNFYFSAVGDKFKRTIDAQYYVATAMDLARVSVAQELYENPTLNSAAISDDFKRYFAIHLLGLTYGSTVKSYLFPGVETFEVKFQSYPSLPPPPPQKKKK
jgi:RHS repeat-associated protein